MVNMMHCMDNAKRRSKNQDLEVSQEETPPYGA